MRSLLHLSDIHFGPKHLPAAAAAVEALAAAARPDVIVVSGDLTQRAKPVQFRAAREYVDRLPAPVVFAPGNHDVPLWRFWERTLAPFGAWRRHFAPELERHFVDAELAVVAVTTAFAWTTKHGRLSPAQLAELDRRLAAAPAGAARVVVAHHPLVAAPELGPEPTAANAGRALALLEAHGVELVLSGHLHHGFVLPARTGRSPAVAHCGTTSSSRGRGAEAAAASLNWIEIAAESIAVSRRRFDAARGEFVEVEARRLPRARRAAGAPPAGGVSSKLP